MQKEAETNNQDLYDSILMELSEYNDENKVLYPYDIKEKLLELRDVDEDRYHRALKAVPNELLAEVIAELPGHLQEDAAEYLGSFKLAKVASEMDTDDAADFIQNISENHEGIAEGILENIDKEDREVIQTLIAYGEDEAGSFMQSELFSARLDENIGESIYRLKNLKEEGEIDNIFHVFITDNNGKFICSIGLEEVIIMDYKQTYQAIIDHEDKLYTQIVAQDKDDISDVVESVSKYNLSVIPIVNEESVLIGRITSDDIYDIIEDLATEDIYNMAGVNAEAEEEEDWGKLIKSRALWLGINLITAIAASVVIGLFDTTIQKFVSLAILMPIIASMGGNAGTQSLTVTVRQLATGDIDEDDAKETIRKEVILSLANGFFFAILLGGLAHMWFKMPLLGVVIALSTIINLLVAGLFGSVIPMLLEKWDIDPAVASTVLLTTITDIVGFFSFLGLAKVIML
jgi:magnesium transporter